MARPMTLGALRPAEYPDETVKQEMRRNLIRMLRDKEPLFPGIIGYDKTVVPQLVNAILSHHEPDNHLHLLAGFKRVLRHTKIFR